MFKNPFRPERQTGTRNGYPVMEGSARRAALSRQTDRTIPTGKRGLIGRLKGDQGPTLI